MTNTASAVSATTSASDSATALAAQSPQLDLDKSATPASYDTVGDVVTYTYTLTNTSNVTLTGPFTVTDDKTTVSCPATSTLAPAASVTCTATYTVTQVDLDAGSVTNHAIGAATFDGGAVVSDPAVVTVEADKQPELTLDKSVTPATYDAAGDVLSYSYLVTNTGNVTITDPVTVTDDQVTVTCPPLPPGGLAPGAALTCTASHSVTQADVDAGEVINTAAASSGTTTSAVDTATATAAQTSELHLTKVGDIRRPTTRVGDVIGYTYTLTNVSNVTLNGPFTVTDDKTTVTCPATTTLAPTESSPAPRRTRSPRPISTEDTSSTTPQAPERSAPTRSCPIRPSRSPRRSRSRP